jgi:hypothetical protein
MSAGKKALRFHHGPMIIGAGELPSIANDPYLSAAVLQIRPSFFPRLIEPVMKSPTPVKLFGCRLMRLIIGIACRYLMIAAHSIVHRRRGGCLCRRNVFIKSSGLSV